MFSWPFFFHKVIFKYKLLAAWLIRLVAAVSNIKCSQELLTNVPDVRIMGFKIRRKCLNLDGRSTDQTGLKMIRPEKIVILSVILIVAISVCVMASPVPDTVWTAFNHYNGVDGTEMPSSQPGKLFSGPEDKFPTGPFTKLDIRGRALKYSASSWAMALDNATGLIWEVKQTKDGTKDYGNPNDADNTYTWFDSNPATNGGKAGKSGYGTDTEDFIKALNSAKFGGYTDWRLPTREELRSIVDFGRYYPAVNADYFPNTVASYYWSSTTHTHYDSDAWIVYFYSGHGHDVYKKKSESYYVRAVRGGRVIGGRPSDSDVLKVIIHPKITQITRK